MKKLPMLNKEIVCFTSSFPFGNREIYFETELYYLSSNFKQVYIIPLYNPYKSEEKRPVPGNVTVLPILVDQGANRILEGIFNFSPFSLFINEFFEKKVYKKKLWFKNWLNDLLVFRTSISKFEHLKITFPEDAILYSYWANMPLFASPSINFTKIVRMHGGDFYIERKKGYLPIRKKIYENADLLIPISNDICNLLEKRYKIEKNKIWVNYLGVKQNLNVLAPLVKLPEEIVVVSCSNLDPLKRTNLIPEILKKIKKKVTWVHFGDGIGMDDLVEKTGNMPKNVTVKLMGRVSQPKLMDFYLNNHVTWFLNVSSSEGVPVSIMEAFSFGIPVIATDVGGTSEIVNESNGILIPVNFQPENIAHYFSDIELDSYNQIKQAAYSIWKEKFNADRNYEKLTKIIAAL